MRRSQAYFEAFTEHPFPEPQVIFNHCKVMYSNNFTHRLMMQISRKKDAFSFDELFQKYLQSN